MSVVRILRLLRMIRWLLRFVPPNLVIEFVSDQLAAVINNADPQRVGSIVRSIRRLNVLTRQFLLYFDKSDFYRDEKSDV